jgi:hypothetical protein
MATKVKFTDSFGDTRDAFLISLDQKSMVATIRTEDQVLQNVSNDENNRETTWRYARPGETEQDASRTASAPRAPGSSSHTDT